MILEAISEAQGCGARLSATCRLLGVSSRTIQRWRLAPEDRRCGPHHAPRNSLSDSERASILALLTSPAYEGLSPKQLVPHLADEGIYVASESTMYRLQRRFGLRVRRRVPSPHVTRAKMAHRATGSNQVWSWDITWLPTLVMGKFLYLYLVMDVWSRRIVGWDVRERESADDAAALIRNICSNSGINPKGLILHSDNGKPMRGSTMVTTLQWLGVIPSFSRPQVSADNPYSEALFRTLKYTPAYPRLPFSDAAAAREWVQKFASWYNNHHRHSAIRYVTPNERHSGRERRLLAQRHALYQRARKLRPERWSRSTRNWTPVGAVLLNPDATSSDQAA